MAPVKTRPVNKAIRTKKVAAQTAAVKRVPAPQTGFSVEVFEALPVLGGMLRVGIPEYRLPKKVLEEEIDQILEMGVKAEMNVRFGEAMGWSDLKEYQAVFLAMGNHRSKTLGVPGDDAAGVMSGVEFLRKVSLGQEVILGKRVAVIGGGNTAIDAARTAVRLGAKPFIVYRRTKEEMPAFPAEIPTGHSPEPASLITGLVGGGIAVAAWARRRRNANRA